MGDSRYNMGNSLMVGCAKMGMHFVSCAPEKYFQDPSLIETCRDIAAQTGAELEFITDPVAAVKNADVIYTDVWVSMGEPAEVWAERIHDLLPYQVNQKLMDAAGPDAVFMHCLPAFHDLKTSIGREIGEKFGLDAMEGYGRGVPKRPLHRLRRGRKPHAHIKRSWPPRCDRFTRI
jgi:ornithine carbamoyltransferase